MRRKRSSKGPVRGFAELVFTVALALFLALAVQAYAVKPYKIPSESMYPTLKVGQRVLVNRASRRLGAEPKVGDVTVFTPPADADAQECSVRGEGASNTNRPCSDAGSEKAKDTFVKRIVAGPGDRIAIRNGHVVRNGKLVKEPYASSCSGQACDLQTITVPKDHWFMMGDNRGDSDDSRYWGAVPTSWIIGKAVATYWPPKSFGGV